MWYVLRAATKHGLLVVEGDEAKLPEVRKPFGRNISAFILSFISSGLGSGDSKLQHDMWITTLVTLLGCVRSYLHCALAVRRFAYSLESAGPSDLAVDSMGANFSAALISKPRLLKRVEDLEFQIAKQFGIEIIHHKRE
jgi:hypothetical protein